MWWSYVSHGAIVPSGPDLEVREGPADPALRPVTVGRPDVALDLLEPTAGQPRRGEGGPAGVPVGELVARLEPAAVDADDPAGRRRGDGPPARGRRCRPRTARPTTGRSSPRRVDQRGEVVGDRRDVVGPVRLRRSAVPAEVHRDDRMAVGDEAGRDAVPHPRVRGEAVDEEEGRDGGPVPSGASSRAPTSSSGPDRPRRRVRVASSTPSATWIRSVRIRRW